MSKGLGKGLGALIAMFDEESELTKNVDTTSHAIKSGSTSPIKTEPTQAGVVEISISTIDNNSEQPRKQFDPVALQELADSIRSNGIFQPIILNKVGARYMIVAGERRWRAAKLAGLQSVPAIVRNYSPRQVAEIALVENLQRENLNEIELALGIKKLMEDFFLTQEKVSIVLGKSRSSIANTLRLLNLPTEVQQMVQTGHLSPGHAKCLVAVSNPERCIKLARQCIAGRLSVRELEDLLRDGEASKIAQLPKRQSPEIRQLSVDLTQALGTKVLIQGTEDVGKIIIEYYDRDGLDALVKKIIP